MTETFQVGEIAYLRSGSPPMTVTVLLPGDMVRLTWMAETEVRSSRFPGAALTHKKPRFKVGKAEAAPVASEEAHEEAFPTLA